MLEALVDRRERIDRGNRTLIALRLLLATLSLIILLSRESSQEAAVPGQGRTFFAPGQVTALAFSPDGKYLYSGGTDATIRVWNLANGSEAIPTIEGHGGPIYSIAPSPSGRKIASAGADGTIRIFKLPEKDGTADLVETFDLKQPAFCLDWTPEGDRLLSGGGNSRLQLWQLGNSKPIYQGDETTKGLVFCAFLKDSDHVVTASILGQIRTVNLKTKETLLNFRGHIQPLRAAALSASGRYLATGGGILRLWDLENGTNALSSEGHERPISALAFATEERFISGGRNGRLMLWSSKKIESIRTFGKHRDWVLALASSPDGKLVASGTADQSVRLWDPNTGKQIRELAGHRKSLSSDLLLLERFGHTKAKPIPLYLRPEGLIVLIVLMLTILYTWALRNKELAPKLAFLQSVVDVFLISALVYQTGGSESPFLTLYLISISAVAFVLSKQGAIAIAALTSTLFSFLVLAYGLGYIPESYLIRLSEYQQRNLQYFDIVDYVRMLLLPVCAFFLVAVLAGNLSQRLTVTHLVHQEILDGIGEGILVLDPDLKVLYSNVEALKMLGLSRKLEGETLKSLLGEDIHQAAGKSIWDRSATRTETRYRQPEGTVLPFSVRLIPVAEDAKSSKGLIVVLDDITAEKKMEEFFKHKERIDAMGQISASIAHEIRNPLASIRGAVQEIARATEMSEDKKILIEIVLSESDRLDQIISDFLKYARMRPPLHSAVNLETVLSDFRIFLVARKEASGVDVRIEIDEPMPKFPVDAEQLRQVLLNLSVNAIQAMESCDQKILTLRARPCERYSVPGIEPQVLNQRMNRPGAAIEIIDTGPGLDAEAKQHLFEPFFTTKTGGTGLGLAIVARIIQGHEGLISVVDADQGGTRFIIWLPMEDSMKTVALQSASQEGRV